MSTKQPDRLSDARFIQALQHAPDADLLPDEATRRTIVHAARQAIENETTSAPMPKPKASFWGRLTQKKLRMPWNAGFVTTLLVGVFVAFIWRNQDQGELPPSETRIPPSAQTQPEPEPLAQTQEAAPQRAPRPSAYMTPMPAETPNPESASAPQMSADVEAHLSAGPFTILAETAPVEKAPPPPFNPSAPHGQKQWPAIATAPKPERPAPASVKAEPTPAPTAMAPSPQPEPPATREQAQTPVTIATAPEAKPSGETARMRSTTPPPAIAKVEPDEAASPSVGAVQTPAQAPAAAAPPMEIAQANEIDIPSTVAATAAAETTPETVAETAPADTFAAAPAAIDTTVSAAAENRDQKSSSMFSRLFDSPTASTAAAPAPVEPPSAIAETAAQTPSPTATTAAGIGSWTTLRLGNGAVVTRENIPALARLLDGLLAAPLQLMPPLSDDAIRLELLDGKTVLARLSLGKTHWTLTGKGLEEGSGGALTQEISLAIRQELRRLGQVVELD